jgi:pseudaminic acid biosynthesis-associated methylase
MPEMTISEAERLEALWSGDFGNDYVERNLRAYNERGPFWTSLIGTMRPESVLEVGSNVGGNLQWVAGPVPADQVVGVDVNRRALQELQRNLPGVRGVWSSARELPFADRAFDLVFTMGVLIHQPEESLPTVMDEMVRVSSRYVLCGEYYGDKTTEVPYRGYRNALFRRDYGGLFALRFSGQLQLAFSGFLGTEDGFDDVTWWLFERTS